MSIQEHLNKIRNAIYGREVRESIAKGIETAYDDASEKDNANMEVKIARGTHPNLRSRLDETTAQLAQNESELTQLNAKKADKTELQSGLDSKVGKGENESITKKMLSQEIKEELNGGEIEFKLNTSEIEDDAVTSEKRTALGDVGQMILGYGSDKPIIDLENHELKLFPAVYILHKKNRWSISEQTNIPFSLNNDSTPRTNQILLFNTNDGTLRFLASNTLSDFKENEIILMSISLNRTVDSIRSYYSSINFDVIGGTIERDSQTEKNIETLEALFKNLNQSLDVIFELGGWLVFGDKITNPNPANLRSDRAFYLTHGTIIEQEPSDLYEYEVLERSTNEITDSSDTRFVRRTGYLPFGTNYTISNNNYYYIIVRRNDGKTMVEDDLQPVNDLFSDIKVVFNSAVYGMDIESINADIEYLNDIIKDGVNYSSVDKFNMSGEVENTTIGAIENFFESLPEPQEFHDSIIDMVNTHSDIASYELRGQDDYGYNLYKYEIKPLEYRNSPNWNTTPTGDIGEPLKVPKIIVTSGVHGSERNANFVAYYLLDNLLNNPNNIETFDTLAQNIHWVFVPMCNPSGYVDNTYNNRNDVNINRDFPPYGSVTQPETQIIKDVFDEHSDADYHIDYHNFTPQDGKLDIIGYALTDVTELKRLTTNAYKYVGRQWQLKDSRFPQSRVHQWGYTSHANVGTSGRYTESELGIPSSIVETPKWQLFFDEEDHGMTVTQQGVDVISNVLINIVKARV